MSSCNVVQDYTARLKSKNLSLNEAIDMTHKQPQIAEIVVYVWSYVLLVVHARKQHEEKGPPFWTPEFFFDGVEIP